MTQSGPEGRLDFFYDDVGDLLGFTRNGSVYYYVRNGQNDIIGILNSDGQQVVRYEYDSWGKLLSVTGDEAETVGQLNPFRYRGYYYDSETSLYYLNSRYYDPSCGRFLNADFALGVNEDLLSNNVFIYCSNNPVNCYDDLGEGKLWNKIKEKVSDFVNWITGGSTPPSNPTTIGHDAYIKHTSPSPQINSNIVESRKNSNKGTRKDSKKGSDQRKQAGSRERNVAHPNGEEHSRVPKGNRGVQQLVVAGGVIVVTTVAIIYVIGNDVTGVGVADDTLLIPLVALFHKTTEVFA